MEKDGTEPGGILDTNANDPRYPQKQREFNERMRRDLSNPEWVKKHFEKEAKIDSLYMQQGRLNYAIIMAVKEGDANTVEKLRAEQAAISKQVRLLKTL